MGDDLRKAFFVTCDCCGKKLPKFRCVFVGLEIYLCRKVCISKHMVTDRLLNNKNKQH